MKITLSENLRKLRRDRGMTQEELAGFLGISYQAVSKWERGDGYPDITMLPILANFFGITVDTLIGNDIISREEHIRFYCSEYERLRLSGHGDEAVTLAAQAYREYPYDWDVIDIYCRSLTRGYSVHPGEKMPELRTICRRIMEKCPTETVRMHAVYSMIFAEDDENVEEWFARVPGTYDFTEWERREDRYYDRGQMEKFEQQKQENMLTLYQYLDQKFEMNLTTPEQKISAYRHRIALFDALFTGKNARNRSSRYASFHQNLAEALFRCGKTDEGFDALETAVACYEEWFAIPVGTELTDNGIFDRCSIKKRGRTNPESVLRTLAGDRIPAGFAAVAEDNRYRDLVKRIRKYL